MCWSEVFFTPSNQFNLTYKTLEYHQRLVVLQLLCSGSVLLWADSTQSGFWTATWTGLSPWWSSVQRMGSSCCQIAHSGEIRKWRSLSCHHVVQWKCSAVQEDLRCRSRFPTEGWFLLMLWSSLNTSLDCFYWFGQSYMSFHKPFKQRLRSKPNPQ